MRLWTFLRPFPYDAQRYVLEVSLTFSQGRKRACFEAMSCSLSSLTPIRHGAGDVCLQPAPWFSQ